MELAAIFSSAQVHFQPFNAAEQLVQNVGTLLAERIAELCLNSKVPKYSAGNPFHQRVLLILLVLAQIHGKNHCQEWFR